MPADIAEVQGQATMAYQGETPWHKLGTTMTGNPDVPHALKAAHLDWEVQLKSMFYRVGDKAFKVPSRRAVVRDTDNKLLATVGGDYVQLQNKDAFGVLQPACEQFGVTIETAGALGRGDRTWMLAKLPKVIEPVAGDKIEQFFLVVNGHNGWTAYTARGTDVRVVCANTLAIAMGSSKAVINLKHVQSTAAQFDQVADMVTMLLAEATKRGENYTKLAGRKLSPSEVQSYIDEVLKLGPDPNPVAARRRDTIVELTKSGKGVEFAPGTAWAAFNAITEYIDHVRPAEAKNPRTIAQANQSALFGTNLKIKQRALVLANKLAA